MLIKPDPYPLILLIIHILILIEYVYVSQYPVGCRTTPMCPSLTEVSLTCGHTNHGEQTRKQARCPLPLGIGLGFALLGDQAAFWGSDWDHTLGLFHSLRFIVFYLRAGLPFQFRREGCSNVAVYLIRSHKKHSNDFCCLMIQCTR